MPTPPKAELKDYVWCVGCLAYVPKKLLRKSEAVLFGTGATTCPDGHTELQEVAGDEPPKPA